MHLTQLKLFSCVVGRKEPCKQISLACVGSARSVQATLGLPPLTGCALSCSTLLRLQNALQGNCLRQALGCMYFPGLSHSGSGSSVYHKGTDSVGPAFCALSLVRETQAIGCLVGSLSQVYCASYHLPGPSRLISWVCPRSRLVCFPSLHYSGSRLLCRGTVQSGPWVLCVFQV